MLVALLKRPPLFGATVKSFDPSAAGAVPGVVKVVQVPHGVAVVAKSFWRPNKAATRSSWNGMTAAPKNAARRR